MNLPNLSGSADDPSGKSSVSRNKLIGAIVFAVWFIIYGVYIYSGFAKIAIDSDFACMVLEASDFLSGNVFLSGWYQTGISFLTTDLIYFVLGVLVEGVSLEAYILACTLMFLVMTLGARLLLRTSYSGYSVQKELMFLAIAGFPCVFSLTALRSHAGGMLWIFLSLVVLLYIEKTGFSGRADSERTGSNESDGNGRNNGNGRRMKISLPLLYAAYILLLALACIGDSTYFIVGVVPAFVYAVYRVFTETDDKKRFLNGATAAAAISAAVLSIVFSKLYYMIGGAVKNGSKESTMVFESFEGIKDNVFTYLTYLFNMNDAGFMGLNVASPETLFLFLHAAVIPAGFFVIILCLRDMLKGTEKDPVSICLSLGFLMISAAVILTDIMGESKAGRYFSFAPVIFAILIIRYADRLLAEASEKEEPAPFTKTVSGAFSFLTVKRYPAAIVVLSVLMIAGSLLPFSVSFEPAETQQTQLADFLVSQGLVSGYAQHWDASAVTVASENKVKVRAVRGTGSSYTIYRWFCNEDWYDEPANFFVARKVPFLENYSAEKVVKAFGEPQQILENDKYYIYVYDRDISKELK
ncbi:MAG: hypothetical protein II940_02700 [Methanosarcinaceae archaeon]|nr:hypothetical protein [Methanosarcinaceae archaeon]